MLLMWPLRDVRGRIKSLSHFFLSVFPVHSSVKIISDIYDSWLNLLSLLVHVASQGQCVLFLMVCSSLKIQVQSCKRVQRNLEAVIDEESIVQQLRVLVPVFLISNSTPI